MSNNYIRQSARGYEPLRANDLLYSEQRTLFFTDQVNTDTIKGVVQELMFLDSESSEPITLYVGSPGGDVTAGLMLYDTIRSMRSKVVTIASGIAASMGAIILLAGDERKILPNSKVMIHDPAYFGNISGKKPHQLRSQLEDLIMPIIIPSTNKSVHTIVQHIPIPRTREPGMPMPSAQPTASLSTLLSSFFICSSFDSVEV